MCGFFVSLGLPPSARKLAAIKGRGPDGQGLFTTQTALGPLELGHARLSIIDLSAASNQPFHTNDDVLVFNGAIYNYQSVRERLKTKGLSFQTEGDTEVLAKLLQAEGTEALQGLDGAFALAQFDPKAQTLTLARDRFGEKPLFYAGGIHQGEPWFLAGSHPSLFEGLDIFPLRLNAQVCADYLNFGRVDRGEDTFFAGVKRLKAGHAWSLNVREKGAFLRDFTKGSRPWGAPLQPSTPRLKDPTEAKDRLRAALQLSVKRRLLSTDVPFGACLSGGLDSSLIVAMMNEGHTPHCVSVVFPDQGDYAAVSEARYVAALKSHLNLTVTQLSPDAAEIADDLDRVLALQGEPFPNSSIGAQALVFTKARELGLKVMLDGQGADELFGGYPPMLGAYLKGVLLREGPSAWKEAISALCEGEAENEAALRRDTMRALLPESARRFGLSLLGRYPPKTLIAKGDMPPAEPSLSFENLCVHLLRESSLPALLRFEDQNALGTGVESRLAFLSPEVVQVAMDCDASLKVRQGWRKAVLRDVAKDYLPEIITDRRKKLGFSTPHHLWMHGALGQKCRQWIEDYKHSAAAAILRPAQTYDLEQTFRVATFLRWAALRGVSL